ncbi:MULTISPECIES: RNA polymerase factor sigma-54 [Pseudoxanthomonas]|uniref:RNA polymerase sigma-54 factor n=1 Tax=Pseudoxanthomonas winnipegensis TaxID=2480810 RepID=A0A4Q8LGN9_9GAMM|nr:MULTISPECIES: RNA polymerase factor sigma-54 [Pseudoxanthomonas]TAA28627.1 RNA polymerase sigma-54 factor [Pseudoxanthomonas winnipegensis]TMN17034.1 RNA polymerase factor sigma-54 [Pseudoxanthomonas sp. X-1]UAY74017.1 RNA polymerase factor sigma-54 [Pseudoxanthomonas sp. X-1]
MKGTLTAKMAQGVNLTPQLLQSIRLLQLTSQQLELELAQTLERNPLLETDEAEAEAQTLEADDAAQLEAAAWDELPEPAFMAGLSGNTGGALDEDATARIAAGESSDMRVRLLTLLAISWDAADLAMAAWWLDRCDDRGYLEQPLDALLAEGALQFELDALQLVRQRLLHGEWAGMAAADPAECLRAQLRTLADSPARTLAARILADHLDLLAAHDDAALAAATGSSVDDVRAAVALVLTLRAHPVEAPAATEDSHILPDVVAWFAGGAWRVALGRYTTPRVRISAHCERALAGNGGENAALRGLLDEARWLVRGLNMRNDTLLRTAQLLVERQRGFLEQGEEAILPLTLREVADAIGVHESTVSRIVAGKYLQTPRGTIELKRLFAVRLEGADVSGSAVRAMVKRLIEEEPRTAPLADEVIASLLARQGVRIARRTVAKYRDQLAIGPAKARQLSRPSISVAA